MLSMVILGFEDFLVLKRVYSFHLGKHSYRALFDILRLICVWHSLTCTLMLSDNIILIVHA